MSDNEVNMPSAHSALLLKDIDAKIKKNILNIKLLWVLEQYKHASIQCNHQAGMVMNTLLSLLTACSTNTNIIYFQIVRIH